jgi:putative phosphoribosyl transferase
MRDHPALEAIRREALWFEPTADGLGHLVDAVADAELVLIGEATHGTHEFYNTRAELTKALVLRKGFNVVAVEADDDWRRSSRKRSRPTAPRARDRRDLSARHRAIESLLSRMAAGAVRRGHAHRRDLRARAARALGARRGRPARNLSVGAYEGVMKQAAVHESVRIEIGSVVLNGDLHAPDQSHGLVVFAHGSGSSRFSRRNRLVAGTLETNGFATLLLDLLTPEEEEIDERTRQYRFDIERLATRVVGACDWAQSRSDTSHLPLALFGASTGAAAALIAAAARPELTRAVISRGGRPDLAGEALPRVQAPTLLIVGGRDGPVIEMNREAMRRMRAHVELVIGPGATHLFEEPGALEEVSRLAVEWCKRYVGGRL